MNFNAKIFGMIVLVTTLTAYAWMWYRNEQVPAWHVMIWITIVLMNDLIDYLEN
jgi:hypothetical protein